MYSFLTDESVWAMLRERQEEARATHPHTSGWPKSERSMVPPRPLRYWVDLALRRPLGKAPQYR